jgi:hypothetical protein
MTLPSKKKVTYGPYTIKSGKNKGRKVVTTYDPKTQTTTTSNQARDKKEKQLGRKLRKDEHVDHKNQDRTNDSSSNLRVMSASKNIAKGNTDRARKKK